MNETTKEKGKLNSKKKSKSFNGSPLSPSNRHQPRAKNHEFSGFNKMVPHEVNEEGPRSLESEHKATTSYLDTPDYKQNIKRRRLSGSNKQSTNPQQYDSSSSSCSIYNTLQTSTSLHNNTVKVEETHSSTSTSSSRSSHGEEIRIKAQTSMLKEEPRNDLPSQQIGSMDKIKNKSKKRQRHEKPTINDSPSGQLVCNENLDGNSSIPLNVVDKERDKGEKGSLSCQFTQSHDIANAVTTDKKSTKVDKATRVPNGRRWRAHQMVEDYVSLAGNIMYPNVQFSAFGYNPLLNQYPLEHPTTLGLLTHPIRRPTVIEKWNPYEIAMFEAGICIHGKQFHTVQKIIGSKNTKEVVEFYYVWKKTSHYKAWKEQQTSDGESSEDEDEAIGDRSRAVGVRGGGRFSSVGRGTKHGKNK